MALQEGSCGAAECGPLLTRRFPHLHSVQLSSRLNPVDWALPVLACLPALRRVALIGFSICVANFLALLWLPALTHIELDAIIYHKISPIDCGCFGEVPVSAQWRTLILPLDERVVGASHLDATGHRAVIPVLLGQLSIASGGAISPDADDSSRHGQEAMLYSDDEQTSSRTLSLQKLRVFFKEPASQFRDSLSAVASIRSLRVLDLLCLYDTNAMLAFATAATPSSLPHLRALRCAAVEHGGAVTTAMNSAARAVLRCILRFAPQLRRLQVVVHDGPAADEAFSNALQCSQLRRLEMCTLPVSS